MKIIEDRIGKSFAIHIHDNRWISYEDLRFWLTPFFKIKNDMVSCATIAQIKIVDDLYQEFIYKNDVFYVNNNVQKNKTIYTILTIVRASFKYVASTLGYNNIHATCLDYNGKGILIGAARNQGKTTVLLKAAEVGGFSIVANDQLMYETNTNTALGYPATVGIRNNTSNLISKRALWFVDDPYQVHQKPIIHINDLAQIYKCNVIGNTTPTVLINYEKSLQRNELTFTMDEHEHYSDRKLVLPLDQAYDAKLLYSCSCSFNNHLGIRSINLSHNHCTMYIKHVSIKCGIDRITDMLKEIKTLVK